MRSFMLLACALVVTGCSLKTRQIPDSGIRYAHADYKVLGVTTAEACGTYILGIDWAHLFREKQGSASAAAGGNPLLALIPTGGAPEQGRALYDALGKMPEATSLFAPKYDTQASGFLIMGHPIFGKRCAKVEARGIQIGDGPVPNAQ